MILPEKAWIKKSQTDEVIFIYTTTDHPDSQDGWEVWVDDDGNSYGLVGCDIEGYEFVAKVFSRHFVLRGEGENDDTH